MADAFDDIRAAHLTVHPGGSEDVEDPNARLNDLMSRTYSLLELGALEAEDADPLLGPVVRKGWRTIIGGHTGEGKTTLTMDMVRAIVSGEQFLGWRGSGGSALVVDLEQDIGTAQRRVGESWFRARYVHGESDLAKLMGDEPVFADSAYCAWGEGLDLAIDGPDRQALGMLIEQRKPSIVVIDPLYKTFLGSPTEDELISRVVRWLDELRVKHEFGLILPMHMRKPPKGGGGGFSKHDLYAGGQWIWGAEVILGIKRVGGRRSDLHFFKDRAGDMPPDETWELELDERFGWVRVNLEGGPAAGSTEDRLWKLLQDHPGRWFGRKDLQASLPGAPATERTVKEATVQMKQKFMKGLYPGLVIDESRGRGNRYQYMPTTGDSIVSEAMEMFDATEEEAA